MRRIDTASGRAVRPSFTGADLGCRGGDASNLVTRSLAGSILHRCYTEKMDCPGSDFAISFQRKRRRPACPDQPRLMQSLHHAASWPLAPMLPIAAISGTLGQVQSRPSSRVRSPGSLTDAVVLRSQTGLTGSARPRTISQRGHGHYSRRLKPDVTAVRRRWPGVSCLSRQPTGVGAAVAERQRERRRARRGGGAGGPAGRLETVQKVLTRPR
jgi:hypothetical protein